MSRSRIAVTSLAVTSLIVSVYALQRSVSPAAAADVDDHAVHMRAEDVMMPMASPAGVNSLEQGDLKFPASNAQAKARLAASPRHAEWVTFPAEPGSKDSIMAWIVYPSTSAKAPVVVVVHEIFGLSSWVRGVADQVAADGFIAIAPDFLSRVRGGPSSVELASDTARRLISGVDAAERNRVVAAAANYAMTRPAATPRYGVIGYCWGGQTTFYHSINGGLKGFSGGVAFYGTPYMTAGTPATATTAAIPATVNADSLAKIKTPIMLLNGSKDARISAAMPALDSIMKSLRKNYSAVNYEGAVHGFLRAQGDGRAPRAGTASTAAETEADVQRESDANLAATRDGWPRTIAFLKKNLGVK